MAQRRAHVPKFSDFEGGDDYSYAAHLEPRQNEDPGVRTNRNILIKSQEKGTDMRINRKGPQKSQEKGTGMRINRNGLEKIEEKEAGMRININGIEKSPQKRNERGNDNFPPISGSPESALEVERHNNHRRTNSRSLALEFNSEKSNNDNFVQRNRGKDDRKKNAVVSNYSPGHGSTSNSSDLSHGSVSVPKFGAWDDKDPTSGDGFTVIFNKVKEEKQISASKFPVKPPQVVITHTTARKETTKKKVKSNTTSKNCWRCGLLLNSKVKNRLDI